MGKKVSARPVQQNTNYRDALLVLINIQASWRSKVGKVAINGNNLDLVARDPVIPPHLVRNLDPMYYSVRHHQRQCYSEQMASPLQLEIEGSEIFQNRDSYRPPKRASFWLVFLSLFRNLMWKILPSADPTHHR